MTASHETLDRENRIFRIGDLLILGPTRRSPFSVKPTTEGVSREPAELISTLG
jgi:hypothetical protein